MADNKEEALKEYGDEIFLPWRIFTMMNTIAYHVDILPPRNAPEVK